MKPMLITGQNAVLNLRRMSLEESRALIKFIASLFKTFVPIFATLLQLVDKGNALLVFMCTASDSPASNLSTSISLCVERVSVMLEAFTIPVIQNLVIPYMNLNSATLSLSHIRWRGVALQQSMVLTTDSLLLLTKSRALIKFIASSVQNICSNLRHPSTTQLLLKAASDYGALTASVADFQWSQNFREAPSVWGEMLRPIPVALASCTRFFEAMSAMRESFVTLQNHRVGPSSRPMTPSNSSTDDSKYYTP
ncbi:hypothetical protein KFK09_011224 [Dendrobium nobile]|uniref:Uncharacterized protein n=1 Tax=Dendrobium nobile TaxID=94219 RepID=A0A8T3BC95_DENNO|nr:hypothetical protein KFK09_011224 [Dendrobium nobile]